MSKFLGNDSGGLGGVPGLTQHDSIAGKQAETFRHDIKWNRRKIFLVTLFLVGFYIPLLSTAISSELTILIVVIIGTPILLGIFLGLLYWLNRNYG